MDVASAAGLDRKQIEALVRRAVYDRLPDAQLAQAPPAPRLVVNMSARHVHLNQKALNALFGAGAELTVQKALYQEGAFAAEQTVSVFGPRKQVIPNVRILGPLRDYNQVELAFTDARFLGIDAPVRLSGHIDGTPGCYLVGPAGGLTLERGVIRAARHIHLNPAEAAYYEVGPGDLLRLVVESEQGGVLEGLICRVSDREHLEVHIDTDEGNAIDLMHARKVYLER